MSNEWERSERERGEGCGCGAAAAVVQQVTSERASRAVEGRGHSRKRRWREAKY